MVLPCLNALTIDTNNNQSTSQPVKQEDDDPWNALKQQAAGIIDSLSHKQDILITLGETHIEVEKKPASVFIVVTQENWGSNTNCYEITDPFTSMARISHMSANKFGIGERAEKGMTTQLLCIAICTLILNNKLTSRSIVVAEVDKSANDRLLTGVYTPLGFHLVSRFGSDITGGLVKALARSIIYNCKHV